MNTHKYTSVQRFIVDIHNFCQIQVQAVSQFTGKYGEYQVEWTYTHYNKVKSLLSDQSVLLIWAAELDQRTQRNHLLINILSVQKTETKRNCHFCLNVRNLHIFAWIVHTKLFWNLNEQFKFPQIFNLLSDLFQPQWMWIRETRKVGLL